MKKVKNTTCFLLLFICFFCFSIYCFKSKNVEASNINNIEFSKVSKFTAQVISNPSYMRIYITFNGKISDEDMTILSGEKKQGITDKIFVNGLSVEEHFDNGDNIVIKIRTCDNDAIYDTVEIRYFEDSREAINLNDKQTCFTFDSGFSTSISYLVKGFGLIYNGSGFDKYVDSSLAGMKTIMLKSYIFLTDEILQYNYNDSDRNALEIMQTNGRQSISSASTCTAITVGYMRTIIKMNDLSKRTKIVPIKIESIEKAYMYPNKDISFKVFVDKYIGITQYSHLTMDYDYLRSTIWQNGMFYNEKIISQLEIYKVRESLFKYLLINGKTVADIIGEEGEEGIIEPIRIDYEKSNDYTKYYCFSVYIDAKSAFAKSEISCLDDLTTVYIMPGLRIMGYTVNEFSGFYYNLETEEWLQCNKESVGLVLKEIKELDSSLYTSDYNDKVNSVKESINNVYNDTSSNNRNYSEAMTLALLTLKSKEYLKLKAIFSLQDSSITTNNGVSFYAIDISVSSNDSTDRIEPSLSLLSANLDKIELNNIKQDINVTMKDDMIRLLVPMTKLIVGENELTIVNGFQVSLSYELGENYKLIFNGNKWSEENTCRKIYNIKISSPHVTVIGDTQVEENGTVSLRFDVEDGYKIIAVYINENAKGIISDYTFKNVNSNQNVQIICSKIIDNSNQTKKGCSGQFNGIYFILLLIPFAYGIIKKRKNIY